jgi:MscS family membrane protein
MAAQQTLANVFGSVTIFADQPFAVEDLVEVDGHIGVVEEVGLRTCRIRTLEGTIVTIPNAQLVSQAVENKSPRPAWRYHQNIGLEYGTTGKELRAAMEAIRAILLEHPKVTAENAVRFSDFGGSALELTVVYWVAPPNVSVYLDTISEVNLAIKDVFDREGWAMAFPSMSLYMAEAVQVESRKSA